MLKGSNILIREAEGGEKSLYILSKISYLSIGKNRNGAYLILSYDTGHKKEWNFKSIQDAGLVFSEFKTALENYYNGEEIKAIE